MVREIPIFLHIPRTAGTSLQRAAERFLGKKHILAIYGSHIEAPRAIASQADYDEIKLVRGHFSFGVHEVIDCPASYFTIIRHPTDRVISLYNYICNSGPHPFHDVVSAMSLQDFVRSGVSVEVDNGQCRQIAGLGELPQEPFKAGTPPYGKCNDELFNIAISNINKHFKIVLTFPRVAQLPRLLQVCYQWPHFELPRTNSAKPAGRFTPIDRQAIEHQNELDMRLYHWASATIRGGIV